MHETLAAQALKGITPIPLPAVQGNRGVMYLRLSEDELARFGADPNSPELLAELEKQRRPIRKLAKKEGIEIVGEYCDLDKSAYQDKERPGFEELVRDLPHGVADFVLVKDSDRLYRRMKDLTRVTEEIARYARILPAHESEIDLTTASGILHAQILGAIGEFESRRKAERVRDKHIQRVEGDGVLNCSRRPVGWAWREPCPAGGKCRHKRKCDRPGVRPAAGIRSGLIPHPVEAPLLLRSYEAIADGKSLRQTYRELWSDQELVSRPPGLRRALLAPRNAGLVHRYGVVKNSARDEQQIVPMELWQKVKGILENPARRKSPGAPSKTYLSGLLRCSECGASMNSSTLWTQEDRVKVKKPAYVCGRNQCMIRLREPLDEAVLELIGEWIIREAEGLRRNAAPAAGIAQLKAVSEVVALTERLAKLQALAAAGTMDPDDFAATAMLVRRDLAVAQDRAVIAAGKPATARLLRAEDLPAAWAELIADVDETRLVLLELIDSISLKKGLRGIRGMKVEWNSWARNAAAARIAG